MAISKTKPGRPRIPDKTERRIIAMLKKQIPIKTIQAAMLARYGTRVSVGTIFNINQRNSQRG